MNMAFMPKIAGWLAASVLSLSLAACGDGGNEAPPAAAPTPAPVAAPPGLPSPPPAFGIGIGGALTPVSGSPFPLGRVPARLWTDASGAFLYVSDATGSVSVQAIARDGGSLGAPRATLSGTPLHLGTDLVLPLR